MGFLANKGAAGDAAEAQAAANRQAIAEIRRQFEISQENLDSFHRSGSGCPSEPRTGPNGGWSERTAG